MKGFNKMDKPLVSICIPNYNNGKYLDLCITSAINIEYDNFEIIFVDDCSTDNSMDIAKQYSAKIQIYKNEVNLGQPKNTNKAVDLANGDFIVILHSDDQLLPDFCKKLVPLLANYDTVVMAVGERKETDESSIPYSITPFYNTNCIVPSEKQAKVFMMMSFLPCQVLFKKKAFIESGKVNEKHIVNLDGLLWFQIALQGDVAYIQDEVSVYRIHQDNTTSAYNKTINHMMEYYGTLTEMFKLAKGRKYIEHFFDVAEKRIAALTLRYCHEVIKNKNYELAKQYLRLAQVFDKKIKNDKVYKLLDYALESELVEPIEIYNKLITKVSLKRQESYEPPEGFVKI
jgi:glycosyltransferase involved in cell wall biosynthesis